VSQRISVRLYSSRQRYAHSLKAFSTRTESLVLGELSGDSKDFQNCGQGLNHGVLELNFEIPHTIDHHGNIFDRVGALVKQHFQHL
jgi:hypothetical protein